jgi:hypothetical protein
MATSRTIVVAVPPEVTVTATAEGAIRLASQSAHELNLGGFRLEVEKDSFTLPDDTIVLPGESILVPLDVAGLDVRLESAVALRRPDGKIVRAL